MGKEFLLIATFIAGVFMVISLSPKHKKESANSFFNRVWTYRNVYIIYSSLIGFTIARYVTGNTDGVMFYLFWFADATILIILAQKYIQPKTFFCYSCEKSILIYSDWKCPKCNVINAKRDVSAKCNKCGEKLKSIKCPYCQTKIEFEKRYSNG